MATERDTFGKIKIPRGDRLAGAVIVVVFVFLGIISATGGVPANPSSLPLPVKLLGPVLLLGVFSAVVYGLARRADRGAS
ncbi:MAG: hypothetical protein IBX71_06870 [Candidatus Desulforudis sp.]|nr:hypothetical protein [Desulforudis sp.]